VKPSPIRTGVVKRLKPYPPVHESRWPLQSRRVCADRQVPGSVHKCFQRLQKATTRTLPAGEKTMFCRSMPLACLLAAIGYLFAAADTISGPPKWNHTSIRRSSKTTATSCLDGSRGLILCKKPWLEAHPAQSVQHRSSDITLSTSLLR
jgi:hypothetical protein